MYVVFDCKNNENLFLSIKDRLVKLGYRYLAGDPSIHICFAVGYKDTFSCSNLNWAKSHPKEFTMGSLDVLFNTEEYKLKQDIYVDGYKVIVDKQGERVLIDRMSITKHEIVKLAEIFFNFHCVTEKEMS